MFNRDNPIVFILVVLCSLQLVLAAKICYTDYINTQDGHIVYDNQNKVIGVKLGDYESDFSFEEVSNEDLQEFRNLEKVTRRVLNISDSYLSDIESRPIVKVYEYGNKNWQYFLMNSLPCGYNTYEGPEMHQGVILLDKSTYSNPARRRQTYVHEYIHYLSNQGNAFTVKNGNHFNTALTEAYTEMLCIRVLKDMKEKYIFKTRYEKNIPIARELERASNGVTTEVFFKLSKVNLLADNLENYRELAELAKKRQDIIYPIQTDSQKRIQEILEGYKKRKIW